jgi:hypothetical protein
MPFVTLVSIAPHPIELLVAVAEPSQAHLFSLSLVNPGQVEVVLGCQIHGF